MDNCSTITAGHARIRIRDVDRRAFGRRLRAWYRRHARQLPWRETRDPYRVLVSELMLQQTQVDRVLTKYTDFLARFPTLEAVASASPSQVSEAWTGLGYYARARNLHALAHQIVHGDAGGTLGGRNARPAGVPTPATLPADTAALRQLPGIGPYTAGAVSSFAYERPAALVDTNVARVLTRVFAPRYDPRTSVGRRVAWAIAEHLLPRSGHVAYTQNQALMELGALVCTARIAHCDRCPISICGGHPRSGLAR